MHEEPSNHERLNDGTSAARSPAAGGQSLRDAASRSRGASRWVPSVIGIVLGVAVALAILVLRPREKLPATSKEPEALAGAVLVEDEGALEEVLFQYVPKLEFVVADAYRDFLGTLDPTTKLVAVVPAHGDLRDSGLDVDASAALRKFLAKIDPSGALEHRTRIVETGGPISVWSKDRALVMGPFAGSPRTGLLIPMPPDPKWIERSNDWRTLASVAEAMPDLYYVHELPLMFDAGDFAVTGKRVLVDVNLFTKNRSRGVTSTDSLKELLGKLLNREIILLGKDDGDVPRHHMSMYMAPLGDTVLVGDPRAAVSIVGAEYAPGELSIETGDALKADFTDVEVQRYELAARELGAAGFRVVRIPTVPFDDKTYFAYTNGVYETRGGKKIAWVPQYAKDASDVKVARLDAIARETYADLGWEVRPVAVRAAYAYHGTIGCLANVLARRHSG